MIKRFIIAIVLLAIVAGGIIGFNIFRDQAIQNFFATMQRPASAVSVADAKPSDWTPTVDAIGSASASRGVDLTMETSGIIAEMTFSANQRVEAGEVLVRLNDSVEQAALAASQAQAALNTQTLNRAVELQSRGVGSNQTLDEARAAASASEAEVERLRAVLDQRVLDAPFSGMIGIPQVEAGQYVAPGTVIATLQNIDTMRADFSVPEQSLELLKIGQPVRFGVTEDKLAFSGKVTGIDPKVDPATRLVAVRAEIENPEGKLTPGQFVRVSVQLPTEQNVIALPQTAVVPSLYGDYVYIVEQGQPAQPAPENPEPLGSGETAKSENQPEAGSASGGQQENPSAEGQPNAPAGTPPLVPPSGESTTEQAQSGEKPAEAAPAAQGQAEKPAETGAAGQGEQAAPQLVAKQVFVKIGRRNGQLIEIAEGVKPGDRVVTAGQNRLSNGAPVKIDNSVTPGPATLPAEAADGQ